MNGIERSAGEAAGPRPDLEPALDLTELAAWQPAGDTDAIGFSGSEALSRLLGLETDIPQGLWLSAPIAGEDASETRTPPQTRAALLKTVLHIRQGLAGLSVQPQPPPDSPAAEGLTARLASLGAMAGLLEDLLSQQDQILARITTEQKN